MPAAIYHKIFCPNPSPAFWDIRPRVQNPGKVWFSRSRIWTIITWCLVLSSQKYFLQICPKILESSFFQIYRQTNWPDRETFPPSWKLWFYCMLKQFYCYISYHVNCLCILQPKMLPTYVLSVVQSVEICLLPISSYFSSRQIMYVLHTSCMYALLTKNNDYHRSKQFFPSDGGNVWHCWFTG